VADVAALSSIPWRVVTRVRRDGVRLATRYYVSAAKHGLHYVVYDAYWDRFEPVRTSGAVDVRAEDVVGPAPAAEFRRYHSFPRLPLIWAIESLPIDQSGYVFVDYGSGRGRALLTAGRYPFAKVIGVEFSETLHEEAVRNIAGYPREKLHAGEIVPLHMNALDFEPPENFVAFFFNPFPLEIVDRVAERLATAARHSAKPCFVIFANTKRFMLFATFAHFRRFSPSGRRARLLRAFSTVPVEFFRIDRLPSDSMHAAPRLYLA